MRKFIILLMVVMLTNCASISVDYDYDKAADFSSYSTYNYYPDMDLALSDLDANRLYKAIDSTMRIKGIQTSEEPDFYINIISNYYKNPSNSSVGLGLGGTGGNVGGGVSVGVPIGEANLQRELVFDLIDSQRDVLFWQATSNAPIKESGSPTQKEEQIQKLVAKVFSKYPPSDKGKKK